MCLNVCLHVCSGVSSATGQHNRGRTSTVSPPNVYVTVSGKMVNASRAKTRPA